MYHYLGQKEEVSMSISNSIQSLRALRQTYRAETEKHPVREINQEAADKFNRLLEELKKRYPDNSLIGHMQPVSSGKTQLAGLWAKLDVLEDSLELQ
jgi:hypothetical protein